MNGLDQTKKGYNMGKLLQNRPMCMFLVINEGLWFGKLEDIMTNLLLPFKLEKYILLSFLKKRKEKGRANSTHTSQWHH